MGNGWKKITRAIAENNGRVTLFYEDGTWETLPPWAYLNMD